MLAVAGDKKVARELGMWSRGRRHSESGVRIENGVKLV